MEIKFKQEEKQGKPNLEKGDQKMPSTKKKLTVHIFGGGDETFMVEGGTTVRNALNANGLGNYALRSGSDSEPITKATKVEVVVKGKAA